METRKSMIEEAAAENERKREDEKYKWFADHPELYGLCAWCKTYYDRQTGDHPTPAMSDERFEATRHDGKTSHGCCPGCKDRMLNER